jgi:hypothetical protein
MMDGLISTAAAAGVGAGTYFELRQPLQEAGQGITCITHVRVPKLLHLAMQMRASWCCTDAP